MDGYCTEPAWVSEIKQSSLLLFHSKSGGTISSICVSSIVFQQQIERRTVSKTKKYFIFKNRKYLSTFAFVKCSHLQSFEHTCTRPLDQRDSVCIQHKIMQSWFQLHTYDIYFWIMWVRMSLSRLLLIKECCLGVTSYSPEWLVDFSF